MEVLWSCTQRGVHRSRVTLSKGWVTLLGTPLSDIPTLITHHIMHRHILFPGVTHFPMGSSASCPNRPLVDQPQAMPQSQGECHSWQSHDLYHTLSAAKCTWSLPNSWPSFKVASLKRLRDGQVTCRCAGLQLESHSIVKSTPWVWQFPLLWPGKLALGSTSAPW